MTLLGSTIAECYGDVEVAFTASLQELRHDTGVDRLDDAAGGGDDDDEREDDASEITRFVQLL